MVRATYANNLAQVTQANGTQTVLTISDVLFGEARGLCQISNCICLCSIAFAPFTTFVRLRPAQRAPAQLSNKRRPSPILL